MAYLRGRELTARPDVHNCRSVSHNGSKAGNLCGCFGRRCAGHSGEARLTGVQEGEVEFVVRDGQSIAYEVFGDARSTWSCGTAIGSRLI